jgi:uncharacterized protein (TIGR04255 family)
MSKSTWVHPEFENAPVVETVFSIEFVPLSRWQIPHFGLYWQTIRDNYPKLNVQGALVSQIEDFGEKKNFPPTFTFDVGTSPHVRCWFFNESETQLIQIQHDRFIFNWKRGLGNEPYPHYVNIRPLIAQEWRRFRDFVAANELGSIQARQCETSYHNHLEKGSGWHEYRDLSEVLPIWNGSTREGFLHDPEDIEIGIRYLMPQGLGRLHIRVQPAIRNSDLKEIIQLTFAARGRPKSLEPDQVFEWFDFAQEWVVKSFLDFTSDRMQSLWGKRETP